MILMNKNTLAYFLKLRGPLCGQVVSMLAFFSDDPSSNPEFCNFAGKFLS